MTPNFFLVGGPKCGTTALASYLGNHPNVFITDPKEPCFLADELQRLSADFFGIRTQDDYDQLYRRAQEGQHLCAGEASTLYLSSPTALVNIRHRYPLAKIVAMVRNPTEVAHAFHMQLCNRFHEDVNDFETAWRVQDARLKGQHLPRNCRAPRIFQYRDIAAFGTQLESLLQIFPKDRVHVIHFDDFRSQTRHVYEQLLAFLELPDDGRQEFPKMNEAI